MTKNTWTDDYGVTVKNVHGEDECRTPGACTIHHPSDHGLRGFPQVWRADRGFMERICDHAIGHPDPDEGLEGDDAVHGCDGCCAETEPEPEPEAVFGAEQPVDAEKLFTMDEFDDGTLMQFEAGVYVGMEKAHELAVSEITKLRDSFEAVIECYPKATGTKHTVAQLTLVVDTLERLLLSSNKKFYTALYAGPDEYNYDEGGEGSI
jgi:hypothetical protein